MVLQEVLADEVGYGKGLANVFPLSREGRGRCADSSSCRCYCLGSIGKGSKSSSMVAQLELQDPSANFVEDKWPNPWSGLSGRFFPEF